MTYYKVLSTTTLLIVAALLMQSCLSDLRTTSVKSEGISEASTTKGKEILEQAWLKQGMNKLKDHQVYSMTGNDNWKGMMGKMGKPWPEAKGEMQFKFAINTFDSQVLFLDGKRKGAIAGLQSWKYYEKEVNETLEFKKTNSKIRFGLSAFQYFVEILDRLKNAPIITYAGETKFKGNDYDLVMVSWDKMEPHREHDQYKAYINKETGTLDFLSYTLRENYLKMPGGLMFYGSMQFGDYRDVEGIKIPFSQKVYINEPKENEDKFAHHLTLTNFSFDGFKKDELYPNKEIKAIGDIKILP